MGRKRAVEVTFWPTWTRILAAKHDSGISTEMYTLSNPIEHRLFSYISLNWAGKPLRSFETMLAYIRGTTTETGLRVRAFLLDWEYQRGIKVSDQEMKDLDLQRRAICPNWNYVIKPRGASP